MRCRFDHCTLKTTFQMFMIFLPHWIYSKIKSWLLNVPKIRDFTIKISSLLWNWTKRCLVNRSLRICKEYYQNKVRERITDREAPLLIQIPIFHYVNSRKWVAIRVYFFPKVIDHTSFYICYRWWLFIFELSEM